MFQFINIKILTEQATPKCTLFLSLHYVPRNKFKQTWALFMCCWVLFLSCFINALKSDKIWRFSITLTALNVPEVSRSGPTLPLTCIWSDFNLIYGKAMAPHSSTLAWKIPWVEEPDRLQFMGLRRVRHNWATSLSLFTFMHWRRKWQPTPVFLPGEFQGRGSLVGCRLWGCTESDTTEVA